MIGWIHEAQLVGADGLLQAVLDHDVACDARVHGLVEDHRAAAADALGLVHGHVGIAQHVLGARIVLVAGDDADAGGGAQLAAEDVVRQGQRVEQALGDLVRIGVALQIVDEHQKLVAAEAADHVPAEIGPGGVLGAQGAAQAAGDLAQHLIAGLVAQRVVDQLEAVEIQEEHGEHRLLAGVHALHGLLQALHEHGAIREPGQLVAARGLGQCEFHRLALGNILHDRPDDVPALGVRHPYAREQHRVAGAVLADVLLLVRARSGRCAPWLAELGGFAGRVVGRRDVPIGHLQQFFARIAGGRHHRVVDLAGIVRCADR